MPVPINFNKKIYQAQPYSPFFDLQTDILTIATKQSVTLKEIMQISLPLLKETARDFYFENGKYTNFKEILDFLSYVEKQLE